MLSARRRLLISGIAACAFSLAASPSPTADAGESALTPLWSEGPAASLVAQGPAGPPAAAPPPARERPEPLRKGSLEVGVMGAYQLSASYLGETPVGEVVRMYYLIPKVGYTFLEFPDGWPYRGSFQVFLEPAIAYITHPARTYLLGVSAVLRHNILLWDRVVPYIDGGVGLLNTNLRIQALGEVIEFNVQGGLGVLFRVGRRTTVDAGWRYHHISNAGQTENRRNIGINSHFIHAGFSYHF